MNLRLRPEVAEALRAESARTGLSQQEILRQAVDEHLGLGAPQVPSWPDWVAPPSPFLDVEPRLSLPDGVSSMDLLNELREERL